MSLETTIFDSANAPKDTPVADQPDGFLSIALAHARKSPHRFPLLAQVAVGHPVAFGGEQRSSLKSEWLTIESLAVGRLERDKWDVIFRALGKQDSFAGLKFVLN